MPDKLTRFFVISAVAMCIGIIGRLSYEAYRERKSLEADCKEFDYVMIINLPAKCHKYFTE
jgi:hypothetical protein